MFKAFRQLFGQRALKRPTALENRRVFAIGDIHGCDDLLEGLIAGMQSVAAGDPNPPLFIFLGDYVDRGPASRQVIQRLVSFREAGHNARFLCGNHEESMLNFLSHADNALAWPEYGGRATLASYGVDAPLDESSAANWRQVALALREAMPEPHLRFLYSLEDSIELGDYMFVHAGVRPERPLNRQTRRDLRWIREPFLSDQARLDRIIVHGHTPAQRPYADRRRIGVDTWAYQSGILTGVEFPARGKPRFVQARRMTGGVQVEWISLARAQAQTPDLFDARRQLLAPAPDGRTRRPG